MEAAPSREGKHPQRSLCFGVKEVLNVQHNDPAKGQDVTDPLSRLSSEQLPGNNAACISEID